MYDNFNEILYENLMSHHNLVCVNKLKEKVFIS